MNYYIIIFSLSGKERRTSDGLIKNRFYPSLTQISVFSNTVAITTMKVSVTKLVVIINTLT